MQTFVKALKAVDKDDNAKLSLAKDAWNGLYNNSLVAQPIFDWLLAAFSKSSSFLHSRDAWMLLQDIVSPTYVTCLSTTSLAQAPFPAVLRSLLLSLARDVPSELDFLLTPVHAVLRSLWPHVSPRTSAENILDCYAAVLNVLAQVPEPLQHLTEIAAALENSFRTSVSRSQNKKKIYALFTPHAFLHWVVVSTTSVYVGTFHKGLVEKVYTSATDLFFAPETLRQTAEQVSAHAVIETLRQVLAEDPALLPRILRLIPRLFASFVSTTRKNASALFTAAQNQKPTDLARVSALTFFPLCIDFLLSFSERADAWDAVVSLLDVLRTNGIYKGATDRTPFFSCSQTVIGALVGSDDAAPNALKSVLVLVDLDYDFVLPIVEQLLQRFVLIHPDHASYYAAVDVLLCLTDHHSRSRTVPVYTDHLCDVLSSLEIPDQAKYQAVLQSPLFDATVCDRLASSVRSFLTPGQIPPYLRALIQRLNSFHSSRGIDEDQESPKKKRRIRAESSQSRAPPVILRLAMFIVPSVRSDLLQAGVKSILEEEVEEYLTSFPLRETLQSQDWRSIAASISALRLRYALVVSQNFTVKLPLATEFWQPLVQKVSSGKNSNTELLLECYRLLLLRLSRDPKFSTGFLDFLGDFFHRYIGPRGAAADANAVDLFHILLERFLDVIDASASNDHLDTIVHVLLSTTPPVTPSSSMQGLRKVPLYDVILQALHSAHFWELPRLRASLLKGVLSRFTILDQHAAPSVETMAPLISLFKLLTNFPLEYLSKHSRAEVTKMAAKLDNILLDNAVTQEPSSLYHALASIRIVLSRVLSSQGSFDTEAIPLQLFQKIVSGSLPKSDENQTCATATLDLASLYLGNLLRAHRQNPEQEMSFAPVLKALISQTSFAFLKDDSVDKVANDCSLRLIDLVAETPVTGHFSSAAIQCFHDLHTSLTDQLSTAVSLLLQQSMILSPGSAIRVLHAWKQKTILRRWLGCTEDPSLFLGAKVISRLSQEEEGAPVPTELCSLAFAVFLEESTFLPSFYPPLIPAAYVSLSRLLSSPIQREALSAPVAPLMRSMGVEEFQSLFELIAAAVEDAQSNEAHTQSLLEFSIIMLRNCPSGASKAVHQIVGKLCATFIDGKAFLNSSTSLRLSSLQVISAYCGEFAVSLRNTDVGNVFSILSHTVAPAKQHDPQTSRETFHTVISISTTLIRFRRDLVIHALPHLGFVVQRLMLCLRHVRPQLGGQQKRLVMDTMPQWISADEGLLAEDAAGVSRLLETFNAKTMFRSTSESPQMAESLVKPFSKHAAYVLKSYVDAVNDVLCTMLSPIRQELRPGLFVLCHMVSEHNRDALMTSALDAGGKTTFKGLWKEYEAQKYVGKG